MKVAILILTHKDHEHLKRLVKALNHKDVEFFIHVDQKADVNIFKIILSQLRYSNIHFIKSKKVYWASISQTEARLNLIKAAVKFGGFSHLVMISGQCYPIKPVSELLIFLKNNEHTSFIEHHAIPTKKLGINKGLDRINCYSYNILGKKVTYYTAAMHTRLNKKGRLINIMMSVYHIFKKKRQFPSYVKPYYGIDWWALSSEAAEYILAFVKTNPGYHKYNKHTRHTSEIYFPSILAGTDFPSKLVNKSLHYMEWSKENSAHPIILTEKDYTSLKQSDSFFARKFDSEKSEELLQLIDFQIIGSS